MKKGIRGKTLLQKGYSPGPFFPKLPAGDRTSLLHENIRRNEPFFIVRCTWRSDQAREFLCKCVFGGRRFFQAGPSTEPSFRGTFSSCRSPPTGRRRTVLSGQWGHYRRSLCFGIDGGMGCSRQSTRCEASCAIRRSGADPPGIIPLRFLLPRGSDPSRDRS
jgi:hypothetical protein